MNFISFLKHKALDRIRFCYHLIKDERVRKNFLRFKVATNKKDKSIIKHELKELKRFWGCIPTQYYTHDFYSLDCSFTIDEMKKYIPSYYFYKIIFPQYDDVSKLIPIVENKIKMAELFEKNNIPYSATVVKKQSDKLFDRFGKELNSSEINEILSSIDAKKIFIKPVSGRGGKGIIIANFDGEKFISQSKIIDSDFLASLSFDFVVEEAITQHTLLNQVYPTSVNTLRAITVRGNDEKVKLIAVILRIGVSGSEIDNLCAGGLLIGINPETGECLNPFATHSYGIERFSQHPDTGFIFSHLAIPNWDLVKNEILQCANQLSIINLAGWDIAVTENGITVIEVNTLFGIDGLQSGVGGLRDEFLSGDPKVLNSLYARKGFKN